MELKFNSQNPSPPPVDHAVLFFVLPIAVLTLFGGVSEPDEPASQAARDLETLRADRPSGFPAAPGTHVVLRVIDGDTLDVRAPGRGVERVRLACIDAPQRGQKHALTSRRQLLERVAGRMLIL